MSTVSRRHPPTLIDELGWSFEKHSLYFCAGLGGTLLISIPAQYYRIDRVSCPNWPVPVISWCLSAVYLLAVGLMSLCWLRWWKGQPRLGMALGAGFLLHTAVLLAPPYLSMDPLFYAAIGHAMAKYHANPYSPLNAILPSSDPFLNRLSIDWQFGTSPYFAGWNELARLIASLAGDSLILHLRIYQALGLFMMFITAAIVGITAEEQQAGNGGSTAAAVLFCPLGLIEGTQMAHNDHLLACSMAVFVRAIVKKCPFWGVLALLLAVAVKASAFLFLGVALVALLSGRFLRSPRYLVFAIAATVVIAALMAPTMMTKIARFTPIFGNEPTNPFYCARAIECIPRYFLYKYHFPFAGWAVGIVFRALGGIWLLYIAIRSGREGNLLPWLAIAIFVYYTYLHAYFQAWYLLPLLPLLPFVRSNFRPAVVAICISSISYYAVVLPFNYQANPNFLLFESFLETTMVLFPPTMCWLLRASPYLRLFDPPRG